MDKEIYNKIIKRKQFSKLRKIDVELAWKHFEKRQTTIEDKIKLTRDLLGKSFAMFTSKRFLKIKDFEEDWILKRHASTRERFGNYEEIYKKLTKGLRKEITVLDLGCGVNGFSHNYFPKGTSYFGVESIGQLVDLQNHYFKKNNFKGKFFHKSLFEINDVKKIIKQIKGSKLIFLFKVIDSLEMLEKNYSKKLLEELTPLVERVVVSFATRSLLKKTRFKTTRNWIYHFIKEKFKIVEDFEIGNERYVVFKNKEDL